MASFSSDFDLFCTQSEEELLAKWLSVCQQERSHDKHECGYEVHILLNGEKIEDVDYEEYMRLKNIVDGRFATWSKEQDEEDAREKLRNEQRAKQRQHAEDLRTYNALKKKLEVSNAN
jgi:hypothetical protein